MSKKHSEHSIADILRLKPKWFMEKQTKLEHSQELLNQLAQRLDFGMNHIAIAPFIEVFGTYDMSFSHGKFNKLLFEYAPKAPDMGYTLGKTQLLGRDRIMAAMLVDRTGLLDRIARKKREIANYEDEINRLRRKVQEMYDNISAYGYSVRTALDTIEMIEAKIAEPRKMDKDKMKILKGIPEQFVVVEANDKTFTVVNRKALILNSTNAGSGMAKTLHMGFFALSFGWTLHFINAEPIADYIMGASHEILHPHLQRGAICWGNVHSRANRLMEAKDSAAFFTLLWTVLTTYNGDSPFMKFDSFERRKNTHRLLLTPISGSCPEWWKEHHESLRKLFRATASEEFLKGVPLYTPKHRPDVDPRGKEKKPLDEALDEIRPVTMTSMMRPPHPSPDDASTAPFTF